MPAFEVDYAAKTMVYGTIPVNADDADQAEDMAFEDIKENNEEYFDVQIEMVREIPLNG